MPRNLLKYFADLQRALTELEQMIAGTTLEEYRDKLILRRAVEREFILIAEVVTRIRHHFPATKDRLDRIAPVTGFRNLLVHEYELVDDELVWRISVQHAPVLHREIDRWVMELDPSWDPTYGLD